MQVQPQPHQQEVVDDEEIATRTILEQGQDLPIEGLIFPLLIREGVGQRCYYCWTKTGYSVAFTNLEQYAKHVIHNHEGYSIYVFDEDVDKFKEELKALRRKQRDYPKQFRQPNLQSTNSNSNRIQIDDDEVVTNTAPIRKRYKRYFYNKKRKS